MTLRTPADGKRAVKWAPHADLVFDEIARQQQPVVLQTTREPVFALYQLTGRLTLGVR
ncbi:hypothetical protein AB0918_04905 [Streptomyces sp. NPDC006864]|uniref:hypothetical protein n=1 Tax=Streptomyces sp. NPDC006864 TaxID=3154780 RepID=UPI003454764A